MIPCAVKMSVIAFYRNIFAIDGHQRVILKSEEIGKRPNVIICQHFIFLLNIHIHFVNTTIFTLKGRDTNK